MSNLNGMKAANDRKELLGKWIGAMPERKAMALAKDPVTSAGELSKLRTHPSNKVKALVAANPNTNADDLFTLGSLFVGEVLSNPVLDLWAITDLDQLARFQQELCPSIYHHIARYKNYQDIDKTIPLELRRELACEDRGSLEYWITKDPSPEVRTLLARNSHWPQTHGVLALDPCKRVRWELAGNPSITNETYRIMASDTSTVVQLALAKLQQRETPVDPGYDILANSTSSRVRAAIASRGGVQKGVLDKLSFDSAASVRRSVAGNSETWNLVLGRLLDDPNKEVRLAAAGNPNLAPEDIERHGETADLEVKIKLAQNRSAPSKFLHHCLTGKNGKVRRAAEQRWHYSSDFIRKSLKHGNANVRAVVAGLAGVPRDQLLCLAKDPAVKVRRKLVDRLSCGRFQHGTTTNREVVALLSHDRKASIRARIVHDWRLPVSRIKEMLNDPSSKVRLAIASDLRFPQEVYASLVLDQDADVRGVACERLLRFGYDWGRQNAMLCIHELSGLRRKVDELAKDLMSLVNDPEVTIRLLLAMNQNTPARVLGKLVDDDSELVRDYLTKRDLFPRDEIIRHYAKKQNRPSVLLGTVGMDRSLLSALSHSRNAYVRGMVARNYGCPSVTRKKLAGDSSWFVREQLGNNPKVRKLMEQQGK